MALASAGEHVFEFSSGRLCLDFANMPGSRSSGQPVEHLSSYEDLASWGRQAGVLTEAQAQRLLQEAARRPADAEATLRWAIALREAIYRVFSVVANERQPEGADLAVLNAALKALAMSEILQTNGGFTWTWKEDEDALDRMLWPVVRSAADLLTSDDLSSVRECANRECSWLFMDASRNQSRRWCDMKTCGNRAKARKHYQRKKASKINRGDD
jgi:predicted RNA-binding Zn ribbon-like protein